MRRLLRIAAGALALSFSVVAVVPAAQASPPLFVHLLGLKIVALIGGNAKLTDWMATRAYTHARRLGTCEERRADILALLPDALRFGHLALDAYTSDGKTDTSKAGVTEIGTGRWAVYDPDGDRYAEVRDMGDAIGIAFRGTRLSNGSDIAADVLNIAGIATGYYRWASRVVQRVMHDHPGRRVVVTGHSLGGSLALYGVLHNPGAEAIVFNAAGLSWPSWFGATAAERTRMKTAVTVIGARHGTSIEPISAVSLAHRMVLPGRQFFADSRVSGSRELHSQAQLIATLEQLGRDGAKGSACEGYIAAVMH